MAKSKKWNARYGKSHKKAGQFRSSRALKQDRRGVSQEAWEQQERKNQRFMKEEKKDTKHIFKALKKRLNKINFWN